jgi:hypothetical protein
MAMAGALNLHAAEPFGFEQDQRINQLTLQFGTDTFATTNTFGHAFASVAQSQIQASIAQGITDGSISLLLAASGYSAYFKFTTDRVIAFTEPNSAPRIVHTSKLAQGPFHLAFAAAPQGAFTVIASTNVGIPYTNWTALGTPTQTMYGLYEMTDSTTNLPYRFCRVRSPRVMP